MSKKQKFNAAVIITSAVLIAAFVAMCVFVVSYTGGFGSDVL